MREKRRRSEQEHCGYFIGSTYGYKAAEDEAREKALCELVHNGYLTVEQAAGFAGVTKQKILDWIRQYDFDDGE